MVGQSIMHATVIVTSELGPPIHGVHYWERALLVYMVCIIRIAWVIYRAVEVHLWIIYHDSWISFMMQLVLRSTGMHWRFRQSLLTWFVCWTGMWSALTPRVSWWAPVWRWYVMWGVTAGMIITGVRALWSTPVVMSCLYDVTWNVFCTNHGNCGCDICRDGIETLICCVCICPGDGGEKLI